MPERGMMKMREMALRGVRLGVFGMLILALMVSLCVAGETGRAATSPGIKNAQDPDAYMRDLASRLGSSDGKELLLRGTNPSQPRATAPKSASKPPAAPAAAQPASAKPAVTQPAATTPAVAQPAPAKPAPTMQPLLRPSQPTELTLPQSQPDASSATEAVWSQPLMGTSSSQQLRLYEPNAPAASMSAHTISLQNPAPTGSAQNAAVTTTAQEPNAEAKQRPPLDTATWLSVYNKAAEKGIKDIQAERLAKGDEPWTLSADLEKYRSHAVKDGSRESGDSLLKALERAGLAVGDGVNVFMLGYASDRAQAFRVNDGKSLIDEPARVPVTAAVTAASFTDGLYSLADLITLNALPDVNKPAYKDNSPIVRPIVFAGRTVGGIWRTTEEVGNAVTWGLFDNVTGCLGLLLEDIVEVLKNTGEAVTNIARLPVRALGAKDENAEKAMDWALLVPLELVSNSVEMKGIANTMDYKTAFADKGVIGSIVEFGGSTFIVYRAVDKAVDKIKDHKSKKSNSSSNNNNNNNNNNGGNTTDNPGDTGPLSGDPVGPNDAFFYWDPETNTYWSTF
jgi:hypothetical protein